jgi:hypothetical protein
MPQVEAILWRIQRSDVETQPLLELVISGGCQVSTRRQGAPWAALSWPAGCRVADQVVRLSDQVRTPAPAVHESIRAEGEPLDEASFRNQSWSVLGTNWARIWRDQLRPCPIRGPGSPA